MSELLVNLIDSTHRNPAKNVRGCYKRGDVVVVMPDGWKWGKEERPPKFGVIRVPDLTLEYAQKYVQPRTRVIDAPDGPEEKIVTCRLYCIHLDELSRYEQADLSLAGSIKMSWANLAGKVEHKPDGVRETA